MNARALLLSLAASLLFAACAAPSPAAETVRVVTWNIHHGRGLDGVVDLARLADELAALAPDVVFLQEVDVGVRRSGEVDIPAELARLLGMRAAFGKNLDYQGGDYGNAILSRAPLHDVENLHYRMLREGEQRGVLQAKVTLHGRPVWLWNTHVDSRPDDAERRQNVGELLALLRARDGARVVLAGDFNDLPGSDVHTALCAAFTDAFAAVGRGDGYSFPADAPVKRIDWVLTSDASRLLPRAAWVASTTASDHRPVVVDLELR